MQRHNVDVERIKQEQLLILLKWLYFETVIAEGDGTTNVSWKVPYFIVEAMLCKYIIGAMALKKMHVYCMETLPFVPLFHLHLNFSLSRILFLCRCHLRNKNWKIKLKNYFGSVSISMIIWWNRKRTNILWSVWPYIASMLFNL